MKVQRGSQLDPSRICRDNWAVNLESFLQFVMKHNTMIIQVLFATVLVIVVIVAFRTFFAEAKGSQPESSASGDLSKIEESLKKIIEQANKVPAAGVATQAVASAGGDTEQVKKLMEEIGLLKTELEAKQKKIEENGAAQASGAPAISADDKAKLEGQLKELQAKLQEYEIISEDIADLSLYKEQNAKLQKELESIKKGGPAPAPVAEVVPEVAPPAPEPASVEPVAPQPVTTTQTPAEVAAPAEPEVLNVVDDALMSEFADAVEKQGGHIDLNPATPPVASPATEAPSAPAAEDSVDLGTMDFDKMMQESQALATDAPEVSAEDALGTGLDENKLLMEANALGAVTPEDKKLMGDFENFVKKNEG